MNEAIKQYVMQHEVVSVAEAQYVTGMNYKTVRETFTEMEEKKIVTPIDELRYAYVVPSEEKMKEEEDEKRRNLENARRELKQKNMAFCDILLCVYRRHITSINEIREYCDYRIGTINAAINWMKSCKILDEDDNYLLSEAETLYLIGLID